MNVAGSSGASAAWMLQRLFQGAGETDSTSTASVAERQKMPGGSGHECKAGGASAPQMSGGTMSAMVGMQMGSPPNAEDVASDLVDGLDTNGDGEVSADEIAAAFSQAGLSTDGIKDAVSALDTDGNGSLNKDELTSAVEQRIAAHGPPPGGPPPGGPPPGGPPPNADDAASTLLSAFDQDEDGGLSLSEIAKGLGLDEKDTDQLSALFSSLDSDSDGMLSSDELSYAIQSAMDASNGDRAKAAYTQSAQLV